MISKSLHLNNPLHHEITETLLHHKITTSIVSYLHIFIMDELCKMLKSSKVYCQDQNNKELIEGYSKTRLMLKSLPSSPSMQNILPHLFIVKTRYRNYIRHQRFTKEFRYLVGHIEEWLQQYDHVLQETSMAPYLLCLSHFIDSEILTSIGQLHLDDASDEVGDDNMMTT